MLNLEHLLPYFAEGLEVLNWPTSQEQITTFQKRFKNLIYFFIKYTEIKEKSDACA